MADAGYDVTLIAPHDKAEFLHGVHIEPVSQNLSRPLRMTTTVWEVYRKALQSDAEICHFHDPELLPIGVLLKLSGRRVIYDAHEDLSHDVLIKGWINPSVRSLVSESSRSIERWAARRFDGIVSATPTIAGNFPSEKGALVQNFPSVDELLNGSELPYAEREPLVAYVGAITKARGAHEMVAAMQQLPTYSTSQLLLAGEIFPRELKIELENSPGWNKTDYCGTQDRVGVAKLLGRVRVGLVLLHPCPSYLVSQPTKLFEYMSVGIPVVASNFPAWRSLIDKIGCGLTVNPLNVNEIVDAIAWILEHPSEAEAMGKRGQEAVRRDYNWKTQGQTLLRLYSKILDL